MTLHRTLHSSVSLAAAILLAACGASEPTSTAIPDEPVEAAPTDLPAPTDEPTAPTATAIPATFAPESNPALPPLDLTAGFLPDPQRLPAQAGGPVDVSTTLDGCVGYASIAPNARINYDGFGFVRFVFIGEAGEASANVIVRAPDDNWRCGSGEISFEEAVSGPYEVWIAASTPGETISGVLYVTELRRLDTASLLPPATYPGPVGGVLDPAALADADNIPLPRKLDPDPLAVSLIVGGGVDVPAAVNALYCTGYASVEPDARFHWEGAGFLRFFFLPENGGDTALVVHAPNGSWWCIDDTYGTLDPSLDFLNSNPGEYAVWVSTDQPYEQVAGTLYVTLWDNHPGTFVPSAGD